jgi:hypothetical protein
MKWAFVDRETNYTLYADSCEGGMGFYIGDEIAFTEVCLLRLDTLKSLRATVELEIERLIPKPFKFCGYTPIHPSHVHCTPDSKLLKCMGYETYGKSGV